MTQTRAADDYLPGEQTERILNGETALRVWRERRGLAVEDVAKSAGISSETLIGLENRTLPLDVQTVGLLAAALSVAPAWIEREEHEQ